MGKVHKYLGVNIDYSSPGKVILSMVDCIVNMHDDIPEDMKGYQQHPLHTTSLILRKMRPNYPEPTHIFHRFVAQLLYLSNQARKYLQLEVLLLFTRVIDLDTYYCNNMVRVMNYMIVTIGLPLIL